MVLKLPTVLALSKYGFWEILSVKILILAPNALDPFTEVPIPLWTCKFSTEDEKSGKSTQYVPKDSASLYGIPLIVTLTLVWSDPLILMDE